jgi:hypothetical protein
MNLDPGSLGVEDQLQNLRPTRGHARFSAYELRDGTRIWIIADPDTILLPEAY